jgi:hypothetical protein
MKAKLRLLSLLTGMTTMLAAGLLVASSAGASTTSAATPAHVSSAPAATALVTAAHPSRTVILSASPSAHTVTVSVESAHAAPLILTVPAAQAVPNGINCYFPTCGWEFSHAQTVALYAGTTAAALAACHHYLGAVGLTYVCDAVAAWLAVHAAPKAHQCLYVSTLPVGVIKYVSC